MLPAVIRFALRVITMPLDDKHIETKPHRHGPVATYQVLVDDFDRIGEEAESIGSDLTFATFWFSEAVTSTLALPTIPSTWIHIFSAFEMAMLAGYGFGFYFLWRWSKQKNSLKRMMDRVRSSQIPEFGEAGKELRLSELASLPAQQAGPIKEPVQEPMNAHPETNVQPEPSAASASETEIDHGDKP
jgi:hypothetical protein